MSFLGHEWEKLENKEALKNMRNNLKELKVIYYNNF